VAGGAQPACCRFLLVDVFSAIHQRRRSVHLPEVWRLRHHGLDAYSVQTLQIPEMPSCRHVSPRFDPFPALLYLI